MNDTNTSSMISFKEVKPPNLKILFNSVDKTEYMLACDKCEGLNFGLKRKEIGGEITHICLSCGQEENHD